MTKHRTAAETELRTRACVRALVRAALLAFALLGTNQSALGAQDAPTFSRNIAPLLHRHCAPCHRAGEAGPFPLLKFADARKHAADIVEVTASRRMPPWLPDEGTEVFPDARQLTASEIALLRIWVQAGIPEGKPADLPPPPQFTPGWQLGRPDLVVTFPTPYELEADGADVFRILVTPVPITSNQFVRTVEFRPGNRSVHHARMVFDTSGKARKRDRQDGQPGFPGQNAAGSGSSGLRAGLGSRTGPGSGQ
jgi:hypothetical protein